MKGKSIYVALVISILLHFWGAMLLSTIIDLREKLVEEDHTPKYIQVAFLPSLNTERAEEELQPKTFSPPPRETETLDPVPDMANEEQILPPINSEEKSPPNQKNDLQEVEKKEIKPKVAVIKEEVGPQKPTPKEKIEQIKTELETIPPRATDIPTEKIDFAKTESEAKVDKERKGSMEITDYNLPASANNTKEEVNPSPDSNLEEERQPNQIEALLDLTRSDFSDEKIVPPKIISILQPKYPQNLRKRGIEGQLRLKVLIDQEGNVTQAEIHTSSGYQDFDQSAIEVVYQWQFKPAQIEGK
ncbi:MAG: TonB family protein, partial [Atribacterales bacterium]